MSHIEILVLKLFVSTETMPRIGQINTNLWFSDTKTNIFFDAFAWKFFYRWHLFLNQNNPNFDDKETVFSMTSQTCKSFLKW